MNLKFLSLLMGIVFSSFAFGKKSDMIHVHITADSNFFYYEMTASVKKSLDPNLIFDTKDKASKSEFYVLAKSFNGKVIQKRHIDFINSAELFNVAVNCKKEPCMSAVTYFASINKVNRIEFFRGKKLIKEVAIKLR